MHCRLFMYIFSSSFPLHCMTQPLTVSSALAFYACRGSTILSLGGTIIIFKGRSFLNRERPKQMENPKHMVQKVDIHSESYSAPFLGNGDYPIFLNGRISLFKTWMKDSNCPIVGKSVCPTVSKHSCRCKKQYLVKGAKWLVLCSGCLPTIRFLDALFLGIVSVAHLLLCVCLCVHVPPFWFWSVPSRVLSVCCQWLPTTLHIPKCRFAL